MPVGPLSGVVSVPSPAGAVAGAGRVGVDPPAPGGFGDLLAKGLQDVSRLEFTADAVTESLATGGDATITDAMVANTKSSIAVDLLVQVRNRAVEAYQEIMRMQV